jgi:dTDP-4-dehydrorhamnose 3,5-epimerase
LKGIITTMTPPAFPAGVCVRPLVAHRDERGSVVELFRRSWEPAVDAAQWTLVRSRPGTFRGVHVHLDHDDYLVVVSGRASIGLRDLRRDAPTFGRSAVVELAGEELSSIVIPRGVAHGFFFHKDSVHVYALTKEWDPSDELGCHFADPELAIPWEIEPTFVSARDRAAPPLRTLQAHVDAARPIDRAGTPDVPDADGAARPCAPRGQRLNRGEARLGGGLADHATIPAVTPSDGRKSCD